MILWRRKMRASAARRLTDREKMVLAPYFPPEVLGAVEVVLGRIPFYVPWRFGAVTRGNRVYFRNAKQVVCTPTEIAFLGHEIVHVQQYRQGMTAMNYLWNALRDGYERNPYEVEALEVQGRILAELGTADFPAQSSRIGEN